MLPFIFSALTMQAVGRAAQGIVDEVRRQFREIPGLMEGTATPDSARCVDISTRGALREMILPGVMAVLAPIATGFILGEAALGGLLIGSVSAGFMLAIMMASAGGTWDNAKKYVELGKLRREGFGRPQSRGGRRRGRRPLQGHLGAEPEHPAEADGHRVAGVRPGIRGGAGVDQLVSGAKTVTYPVGRMVTRPAF